VRYIQEKLDAESAHALVQRRAVVPDHWHRCVSALQKLCCQLTTVINPTLLNEFSFNYGSNYGPKRKTRRHTARQLSGASGIQHAAPVSTDGGLPNKDSQPGIHGGWGTINSSYYPWWAHHNIAAATNNLSKTVGSHSFQIRRHLPISRLRWNRRSATPIGWIHLMELFKSSDRRFHDKVVAQLPRARQPAGASYDYPSLTLSQDTWKLTPI